MAAAIAIVLRSVIVVELGNSSDRKFGGDDVDDEESRETTGILISYTSFF